MTQFKLGKPVRRWGKRVSQTWRMGLGAVVAFQFSAGAVALALQTTVDGRRVDLDGTFSVREVLEENHATTHERTLEQLRVRAAVALTDWLRFDATATGTNGGPTLKSDRAGVYTWDDAFQDVSPALDLEEAYFDLLFPALDLRLGKQKVAWGKLDRTQPNDLINPSAYSDPFLQDEAERKIGVPALQASYYLPSDFPPESRVTAVWVPVYLPYRFPLARCDVQGHVSQCDIERWFPPAAMPPASLTLPAGFSLGEVVTPVPLTIPLSFRVRNAATPAWRLENNEIGLRYSALVHDTDVALYYFHGFDPQPAFRLDAAAHGQPDPNPRNPLPFQLSTLSGATTLSPEFHQIDAVGADFAYALDRITVRGEGAFVGGRPFSRDLRSLLSDPAALGPLIKQALAQPGKDVEVPGSFVIRDAVEWGVGADYTYNGYMFLLQMNQTDVLHNHVELLIKDVETRLLANLRTSFVSDTVQTQLVAIHAIESDYTILRPCIVYRFSDHTDIEVGYLFIAGRAQSIGGQYRRNDEGFVRVEYKL